MDLFDVARVADVPAGQMKGYEVGGEPVLLVNLNGRHYAIGRRCPHAGGDLSKGTLEGNVVVCPRHRSKFDVTSGERVSGPAKSNLPVYNIEISGDVIRVKL